jgi:hypothetical protein
VEDKGEGEREAGCRWKKGDGSELSRLGGARKCWLGRRQPKEAAGKAASNRIGFSRNGNAEEQSYLTDLNSALGRSANQMPRAPWVCWRSAVALALSAPEDAVLRGIVMVNCSWPRMVELMPIFYIFKNSKTL